MHEDAQKYQNTMPSMDNSTAWSSCLVVIMRFLYFSILMYGVHENLSIDMKLHNSLRIGYFLRVIIAENKILNCHMFSKLFI